MHIQFKYDNKLGGCLLQRGNNKVFFPDTDKREEVIDTLLELRHKSEYNTDWLLADYGISVMD